MEIQQLQQMKVKELDSLLQQTAEQTLPELLMKLQQLKIINRLLKEK